MAATETTTGNPTTYYIVVTGSELLRGIYPDGHTLFLTRTLNPLGCRCVGSMSVDDRPGELQDALTYAAHHADLIVVTGGLGPTDADVTRNTLSKFTGIPLYEHPKVIESLERRFAGSDGKLRANLRRQALTPEKGTYFNNPNGTAVGLLFEEGQRVIASLPGPPGELQPMVTNELIPYLVKRFGIHSIGASLTMRFVNIGESSIDQTIHDRLQLPGDLIIYSLFEQGRVDLTFAFPSDTAGDRARLKALEKELLGYIGEYLYADDGSTLEDRVIALLAQDGSTLVTAEIGSGGAIAASLNNAESAPKIFSGGHVAPNYHVLAKMLNETGDTIDFTRSGDAILLQIAKMACRESENAWAIAVSGIETDNDSRYVLAVIGSEKAGFDVKRIGLRGNGRSAQDRLVTTILDYIRRKLQKI